MTNKLYVQSAIPFFFCYFDAAHEPGRDSSLESESHVNGVLLNRI